ncbi:MAG: hypothetical protein PHS14_01705 [Elusimicrobia bacterium]|nr:hypothetical protein [Elusimicrobiota bacterium]
MEPVELQKALRDLGTSFHIPDDRNLLPGIVRPLLPAAPLTRAFLEETLAPLTGNERSYALEFLARLGRREIADYAAGLAPGELEGSVKLSYARALLLCRDPRGYGILEDLYRHCLEHPDDKPMSVPVNWIHGVLHEQGPGDALAWECTTRLNAMREEPRMLADAKHGRRVGDFVFEVKLSDDGVGCAAAAWRYHPLADVLFFWWFKDPGKFTTVLEHRSRCKKWGRVVTYAEAGRGRVPAGKVLVAMGDAALLLDRAFFEESAWTFALTAIELMKEAGRPVAEGLEARLRAVRARGQA